MNGNRDALNPERMMNRAQLQAEGQIKVFLVEDNRDDADLISRSLSMARDIRFDVERVERLSAGLERLATDKFDIILLDLGLPDSWGLDTFSKINDAFPDLPVIVLTGQDDESLAFEAVRRGAQDYLVKGATNRVLLSKSIRYAIERNRFRMELKKRIAEIKKLERERESMLSMFAHDIKSALVPAVGFIERIMSGKTEKMQDRLERTLDELIAIEHLVTNFSEFARIEAKKYVPRIAACNLDEVLRRQIDSALIKAEKKKISLQYLAGGGAPSVVFMDGAMIKRVLMNLLDNAVKYTEPGGKIVVRVSEQDNEFRVEVEDSGRGIAPDKLSLVFDAFYRAERDQKGSGLGLAISKAIVEAHGGRIWVESTPGRGSVFGFSLLKSGERGRS